MSNLRTALSKISIDFNNKKIIKLLNDKPSSDQITDP